MQPVIKLFIITHITPNCAENSESYWFLDLLLILKPHHNCAKEIKLKMWDFYHHAREPVIILRIKHIRKVNKLAIITVSLNLFQFHPNSFSCDKIGGICLPSPAVVTGVSRWWRSDPFPSRSWKARLVQEQLTWTSKWKLHEQDGRKTAVI